MSHKPSVLIVRVHDAGRSQTAAGRPSRLAGAAVEVRPPAPVSTSAPAR